MKIVILSRNPNLYSTKRLVEAGEKRGYEMLVLDHTKCYALMEKSSHPIFYQGEEVVNVDAIIPRIGHSVTLYGTAIVRQFEMMDIFTTTKSLAITRSRDKLRATQILARQGVDIPKTAFAKHPNDIDDLIHQVGGAPIIIKLLEGTQGLGVVLADTHKAAKSVIEAFFGMNANFLIQEFIKESKGADIRVIVVDGEVVGAMRRQGKEGEFRSNLHRGGSAEMIKLTTKEKRAAVKAAQALGLDIAGVDFLQSERGPLILEVNSSPGLEGIEGATGLDIAGKIIEFIARNIDNKSKKKDKIGA